MISYGMKYFVIFLIFVGFVGLAHAQSDDYSPSGRDYVPYTQNYNVRFTSDGYIDYDLLIAKIMPEIFQKKLRIEYDVYISTQDIVLERGPQIAMYTPNSYNCGYVIDYTDNQVYWLESAINSTDIQYTKIFTETPTPKSVHGLEIEESNFGWCFGPLKQQVAAIFLEEKSYLTDDQEAIVSAAVKHELRGNPNLNDQEFTVGKFNFDYGENVLSFCGEFQKDRHGLKYFGGSMRNNILGDFHLDDKLSPLCAISDNAKTHSIKVNKKSDVPPELQTWKNLRMETVFLKPNSVEKLLERNYMYPETMHYNLFEYSTPFKINLIEFMPEDSNTIWNFEPSTDDTFVKIRVPKNGGNYYMSYGPNEWNAGNLTGVIILVNGVEVNYNTQLFIRAPDAPYPQHHTDYVFKVPKGSSSIELILFIENYVPENVDDDEYQPYTPQE
ncbi:hypothetical protein NZNM25_02150 [Nitrosopumilus zosterae]|uniref:Uncharacterized protein n=2 Tax=Nitrosopumilus zosterae TaxID=718286 RepID=A0A2S2KPA7_9ARCH|nr:hypothetical protein NZNM25_02150 [Nitrosopumilus zosterae]